MERPIKSLSELMDGGVEERFNDALRRIWENVFDPNTDPGKVRELDLKIKIKPTENRDACAFSVDVITKTAPPVPLTQTVMLQVRSDGTVVATERTSQVPGQIDMDGNEQSLPKVITFEKLNAMSN